MDEKRNNLGCINRELGGNIRAGRNSHLWIRAQDASHYYIILFLTLTEVPNNKVLDF